MNPANFLVGAALLGLFAGGLDGPFRSQVVRAAEARSPISFRDEFRVDHDYLSQGVAGRGWDGLVGKGPRATADRIETADGRLYLQSTRGRYQEGWNPLGPLLYKTVLGDFKATVRVVDYESLSYNNCGIMARAADPDDAGPGEDWISVDYFPIYGGIYARMADDNRRTEKGSNGQGRNADKFLQLERVGNLFYLRHSPDGVRWRELPASPITRNDLLNVPLQVGLFQATYSPNQGQVSFDDFSLDCSPPVSTARLGSPADGSTHQPANLSLFWIPGSAAKAHDVYLGTVRAEVEHADRSRRGVYRGRKDFADVSLDVRDLADAKTYYWRVDEVSDEGVFRGDVWSFTVCDRRLETFEGYASSEALNSSWTTTDGGFVRLDEAAVRSGRRAMKLVRNAAGAARPWEAVLTLGDNQDWLDSRYGFRFLRMYFQGSPDNRCGELYAIFEDDEWGTRRTIIPYEGPPGALRRPAWTCWQIDLRRLVENNPAFRLDHVRKIGLGLDARARDEGAEVDVIYVDDISLEYGSNPAGEGRSWPTYVQPQRFVSPVPFHRVAVTGGLWRERMDVNRTVSLPHVWRCCESFIKANGDDSRRLDNFRKAAGEIEGGFTGTYFNDSDVYKILEGTANSLRNRPDPELEAYADRVIGWIADSQWEDGYLYTFYTVPERRPEARWSNVGGMHELYCAGHLIEAAVAYYQATGKRRLLDVAIRFADLIVETFAPGRLETAPGHQEIELALVRLYRVTGQQSYLDTAKFFIDQRGQANGRRLYGTYSQDHVPFVKQESGVGHSVRAGYLYCAATDLVRLNRDEAYANALYRIWDDILNTKTYLSGGLGQPGGPEGFARQYELGNNCYAETCSGIAFAMWNHRLLGLSGESKYADVMERTLLNNMLSALSFEGDRHCYTNPLVTGGRERWHWPGHDCACCPSNLVRVISSISGYAYAHSDDTIFVNQYLASEGSIPLPENPVTLIQTTRYPWDGEISLEVRPKAPAAFGIKLRIPGWAQNRPLPGNLYRYLDQSDDEIRLAVNGTPVAPKLEKGYATLRRAWQSGDTIQLRLPMPVRRVIAHPKVVADRGLVAVERGPLLYCAEFKDNAIDVSELQLPDDAALIAEFEEDFFAGAVTLSTNNGLKLIPYYLYANRGKGWMRVWMPRKK